MCPFLSFFFQVFLRHSQTPLEMTLYQLSEHLLAQSSWHIKLAITPCNQHITHFRLRVFFQMLLLLTPSLLELFVQYHFLRYSWAFRLKWHSCHPESSISFSLSIFSVLEEDVATLSSIPVWEIPWREEPGELQSMGPQRVGHDWATGRARKHCFCRARITFKTLCHPMIYYVYCLSPHSRL